ncbi:TetR/AcrR family transcriptional regulator [Paenibacillus konkukensis]|uniref:TetR/AcrR family transcriptional regulator n=1 Tax=Paenibacillus konkukensis TaxID=2020716 RepID=UPI00201D4D2C|nr:TetR/AcrR family transcriptional regulator C-terminal domain-containing protein [Paenibacillus konkukensis]
MDTSNRNIVSRRSRPAKEPLSREIIVNTALILLKNEGPAGLSMRKVAKALDTGPSSLYVYVANLEELCAYVLDAGLAAIERPDPGEGDWKARLFDAVYAYLKVLYEAPGLAELALTTIPVGPRSLELTEYILQRLYEGGIRAAAAAWGVDLLLLYASSVAFEQSSRDRKGTTLNLLAASYRSIDPQRYPLLTSLKEEMLSGGDGPDGGKERFRWGFESIVQGILRHNE